ncbi:hypothetical protein PVNG_04352 [Plasmodium vivax North Korean]|uniref:Uncharacterized protein n=1 Tax=Plasmodium vivax North Korean TaxID=1035514 RepID=A0A0J9WC74_PLAVI|nr:hypothetical protein PVNG_04352 [Plasmodium vivax North Korean]
MASTQSEPRYLNYNDYKILKIKFNPEWKTDFDQKKFESVINNTLKSDEISKYNDIFKEIFRHISNHNVFINYDVNNACNYISYILPKVVENKGGIKYNQDTFNTTKRFVEEFKKKDGYSNKSCESRMVYIDSNIYEKMKHLYELYDKYYEYINTKYWRNDTDKCNTIGLAMNNHNMIIKYHQDDEDLKNENENEKENEKENKNENKNN